MHCTYFCDVMRMLPLLSKYGLRMLTAYRARIETSLTSWLTLTFPHNGSVCAMHEGNSQKKWQFWFPSPVLRTLTCYNLSFCAGLLKNVFLTRLLLKHVCPIPHLCGVSPKHPQSSMSWRVTDLVF